MRRALKFIVRKGIVERLVKDEDDGVTGARTAAGVRQVPASGPRGRVATRSRCRDGSRSDPRRFGTKCEAGPRQRTRLPHGTNLGSSRARLFQYKVLAAQSNEILPLAAEVAVLWLGRGDEAFTSFIASGGSNVTAECVAACVMETPASWRRPAASVVWQTPRRCYKRH